MVTSQFLDKILFCNKNSHQGGSTMAGVNPILDRLCGLQGTNFTVTDVKVTDEKVVWRIEHKKPAEYICPRCGAVVDAAHELKWIRLTDLPLGPKQQIWEVKRARILCTCSNNVIVERMPFRSHHHRLTQRLVDYIEQVLCTKMFTVADVARLFNLDYGVIYKIDHDVLLRLWQHMEIPDPVNIAVDEKSFQKGHHYVTIVTDTDTKDVIWVSEGNKKESLDQFFQVIGSERCEKIKTVAKDLHNPYSLSCQEYIPHALEVADRFHVEKRLNEAMDECRKELTVESNLKKKDRKAISKTRWVLRYKQENMKPHHLEKLEDLKKTNDSLYEAYLHKEAFTEFFNYKPTEIEDALEFLIQWIVDAFKIKLAGFKKFAEYIKNHTEKLLYIVQTGRTSAISEGINRKITVLKSMAYGYRNIQYFMLKIMQRCGVLGSLWQPESHLYHAKS